MSIDAIGSIGAVGSIGAPLEVDGFIAPSNVQATDGGFGVWFANEVASVNAGVTASDLAVQKLVTGEAQSLHDVMIKMEEAKLSFQLLAQVRNRLLDAYQEVMRMQV